MKRQKIYNIQKSSVLILPDENRSLSSAFTWLWIGESVSLLGDQVTLLTLSLISVQILQASEFDMALLSAFRWLPIMIVGLLAGVWADRYNPRKTMLVSHISRALLIASIPVLHSLGKLNLLFILLSTFVIGIFSVFFDVAFQTFVPELVKEQELISANSKLELSRSLSKLMGPALAGLMTSWLSLPVILAVGSLSFLIATVTLLFIPYKRCIAKFSNKKNCSALNEINPSLKKIIIEGIKFVLKNRILRLSIVHTSFFNFFASGTTSLEIFFANRNLSLSAQSIGLCISVAGVTAMLSSLSITMISKRIGECRAIIVGLFLVLVGMLCLPFSNQIHGAWTFTITQALFGLGYPLVNANLVTLRQKITPRYLLGSVNATSRVFIMSSLPLGAIFSSISANIFGIQNSLILCGIGAAIIIFITTPQLFYSSLSTG